MDAALIRLPEAMVYAGRATDLVAMAGGGRDLGGDDAIRAAVARYRVASAAEEVGVGLNKSVDTTSYADLGTNIARQLDAFRAAVDSFSPPTMCRSSPGRWTRRLTAGAHNVHRGPAAGPRLLVSWTTCWRHGSDRSRTGGSNSPRPSRQSPSCYRDPFVHAGAPCRSALGGRGSAGRR
jgi:hypothetical protein